MVVSYYKPLFPSFLYLFFFPQTKSLTCSCRGNGTVCFSNGTCTTKVGTCKAQLTSGGERWWCEEQNQADTEKYWIKDGKLMEATLTCRQDLCNHNPFSSALNTTWPIFPANKTEKIQCWCNNGHKCSPLTSKDAGKCFTSSFCYCLELFPGVAQFGCGMESNETGFDLEINIGQRKEFICQENLCNTKANFTHWQKTLEKDKSLLSTTSSEITTKTTGPRPESTGPSPTSTSSERPSTLQKSPVLETPLKTGTSYKSKTHLITEDFMPFPVVETSTSITSVKPATRRRKRADHQTSEFFWYCVVVLLPLAFGSVGLCLWMIHKDIKDRKREHTIKYVTGYYFLGDQQRQPNYKNYIEFPKFPKSTKTGPDMQPSPESQSQTVATVRVVKPEEGIRREASNILTIVEEQNPPSLNSETETTSERTSSDSPPPKNSFTEESTGEMSARAGCIQNPPPT